MSYSNLKPNNNKCLTSKVSVLLSAYHQMKDSDLSTLKPYASLISNLRDYLRRSSKFIADFFYFWMIFWWFFLFFFFLIYTRAQLFDSVDFKSNKRCAWACAIMNTAGLMARKLSAQKQNGGKVCRIFWSRFSRFLSSYFCIFYLQQRLNIVIL